MIANLPGLVSSTKTLGTMPAAEKARVRASRQLIVGTYEHAVVGFGVEKSDVGVRASLTFTNAVHAGAVRCVAAWNGFLSSGGADEAIQLCDLTRRVELGSLLQHQATVTSLEFHASDGRCYMFSASDDGVICAWKCPRWECVHMLKGHRGAVNSLSVHPTGRLALSVGSDRTLRTWNLINGRLAYTTRLPKVAFSVEWSPAGAMFAVLHRDMLVVYDAATVSVQHEIKGESESEQLTSFIWLTDRRLLLGNESGHLLAYNLNDGACALACKVEAHQKRVKAVSLISFDNSKEGVYAASVGSDSKLRVWSIEKKSMTARCSVDVPGRPTCMTWFDGRKEAVAAVSEKKAKRGEAKQGKESSERSLPKEKVKKRKRDREPREDIEEDAKESEAMLDGVPKKKKAKRKGKKDAEEDAPEDCLQEEQVSDVVPKKKSKRRKSEMPEEDADVLEVVPRKKSKRRKSEVTEGDADVLEEEPVSEALPKRKKTKKEKENIVQEEEKEEQELVERTKSKKKKKEQI